MPETNKEASDTERFDLTPMELERKIGARSADYGRYIGIALYGYTKEDAYLVDPESIKLKKAGKKGEVRVQDTLQLKKEEAQKLMNDLWDAGIRPDQVKLQKLQTGAIQEHLKDMRSMVFDHLLPVVKRPPVIQAGPPSPEGWRNIEINPKQKEDNDGE